ncbi:ATP-dependent DNA helicase [bacterium]|nr:ATP-dependent DNA helicase [bacterium]
MDKEAIAHAHTQIDTLFSEGGVFSARDPAWEPRKPQIDMAHAVLDALAHAGTLVAEAPTGTGKTLAYLVPALLYDRRLVISTRTKNLQEQIMGKDWPFVRALGFDAKVMVMKGRENYLCPHRYHRFLAEPRIRSRGEAANYERLVEWATTTQTGDRAELPWLADDDPLWPEVTSNRHNCPGKECQKEERCFLRLMRRKASNADILIVNHHLFFADLALKQGEHGEVIPDYQAVIFDEAHELEDVATAFFAARLTSFRFDEIDRDIVRALSARKVDDDVESLLTHVRIAADAVFDHFRRPYDGKRRLRADDVPPAAHADHDNLRERLAALSARLAKIAAAHEDEDIAQLARRANEIGLESEIIFDMEDASRVRYAEQRGRGVHLVAEPIEPAVFIKDALFKKAGPVVFTSATLATGYDFSYLRARLGLDFEIEEMALATCFDHATQAMLYVPREFPQPHDAAFADAFETQAEKILLATRGRAFLLFTSYRHMREQYERLASRLPFPCLLQGEGARSALLDRFRAEEGSVLFATSSFWQGVDVKGEALSCVIIDKLPFSAPGEPVIEARIEAIKERGGNAFFDYQVPQAIITLKQGLGRLIRHREDKGLLALMDTRVWQKGYGKRILAAVPDYPVVDRLENALAFANKLP